MPAENVWTGANQSGVGGDWFSQQQIQTAGTAINSGVDPNFQNPWEGPPVPGGAFDRAAYDERYRRGQIPGSPLYEASRQRYPDIDPQTGRPWEATDRGGWGQNNTMPSSSTAPPAGTAPGGTAPSSGADPYAIMREASQGLPPTAESLDKIVEALRAQGIPAAKATHANNSLASDDVIVLPDGTEIDAINDVGGAGAKWGAFSPTGQYDPNRSVVGPGGQLVKFSDYLQQQGRPVPQAGMTPLSGVGGGAAGQEAALMSAPGFQFRISEGQKALERSAASRGTLLTGGTLKGITRYGQDFASNEYNNRYNQLFNLSQLGLNAAGTSGTLYASQAGGNTDLITGGANAGAASTIAQGNATAQTIGGLTQGARDAMLLYYLNQGAGKTPFSLPNAAGTPTNPYGPNGPFAGSSAYPY